MRINKYLAECGLGSRRKVESLILDGLVSVNGKVITSLAFSVGDKDEVVYNGQKLTPNKEFSYIMLHKPKGYLTTFPMCPATLSYYFIPYI